MKTASIRELHIRTSELVRQAAEGAVIVIDLSAMWRRFPAVRTDSGRLLEEDR